jgi:hypothetical protein
MKKFRPAQLFNLILMGVRYKETPLITSLKTVETVNNAQIFKINPRINSGVIPKK